MAPKQKKTPSPPDEDKKKKKTPPKTKRGRSQTRTGETPEAKRAAEEVKKSERTRHRSPSESSVRPSTAATPFGGPLVDSGQHDDANRGRTRTTGDRRTAGVTDPPPLRSSLSRVRSDLSSFVIRTPRSGSKLRGSTRASSVASVRSNASVKSGTSERQTTLSMSGELPTVDHEWNVREMDKKIEYPLGKPEQHRPSSPTPEEYAKMAKMISKRHDMRNAAVREINEKNSKRTTSKFVEPTASQTIAWFPNSDRLTFGLSRHMKGGDGSEDLHSEEHVAEQETKGRAASKNILQPRKKQTEPKAHAEGLLNSITPCDPCSTGVLKKKLLPAGPGKKIETLSDDYRRQRRNISPTTQLDDFITTKHRSNEEDRRFREEAEAAEEVIVEMMEEERSRRAGPGPRTRRASPRTSHQIEADRRLAETLENQSPLSSEEEDPADQGSANPDLRRVQQARRRRK